MPKKQPLPSEPVAREKVERNRRLSAIRMQRWRQARPERHRITQRIGMSLIRLRKLRAKLLRLTA